MKFLSLASRNSGVASMFACAAMALAGFMSGAAVAQVKDIDDAVYKASRQGMLVQRIAKSYLALAQKIEPAAARKVLNDSVAQFDRHLVELKVFAPTPEIKATYGQVDAPWARFKEHVVGVAPAPTTAARVMELEVELMRIALRASQQLQRESKVATTQLIVFAETDAIYSQRVATLYFAGLNGVGGDTAGEMQKVRDDFVRNIASLKRAPKLPANLSPKIELAESQWAFLDKAIANRGDARNRVTLGGNVFKASERVLEVLEEVASTLEKL